MCSFLSSIFENCSGYWSGQLLNNETIALDHWKICVLCRLQCRLHKKYLCRPRNLSLQNAEICAVDFGTDANLNRTT